MREELESHLHPQPGSEALRALIAPMEPEVFWTECWEQRHVHLDGWALRLRDLATAGALDRLLMDRPWYHPDLVLLRHNRFLRAVEFADAAGRVDVRRALAAHLNGARMVLQRMHEQHEPLRKLCKTLERATGYHLYASAHRVPGGGYLTPPRFEVCNSFILQVEGEQRFELHESPVTVPGRADAFDPERHRPGASITSMQVRTGDVLYIPRGAMYAVESGVWGRSSHICIRVVAPTWAELAIEAISQLSNFDPWLRRSAPPGYMRSSHELGEQLWSRLSKLPWNDASTMACRQLAEELEHHANHPEPDLLQRHQTPPADEG